MNKPLLIPLLLLALATLSSCILVIAPQNSHQVVTTHPAPKPPASQPAPQAGPAATVRAFLNAIPGQNVAELQNLLADTRTCHITQETDPDRPGIWVETWEDWLKWIVTMDQATHIVDKLTVTMVTDDLATATLTAHTDDLRWNVHAAIVLTRKLDGQWRIISWTQENAIQQPKQ